MLQVVPLLQCSLLVGTLLLLLLKMILAHAKLVHTKTGANPIILLDEAVAHLDKNARKKLFDELRDASAQVWATGIDADNFADISDATFVTCTRDKVSPIIGGQGEE